MVIFRIIFPECRSRPLGIPMIEIGVGVFVGAIEREDELLSELLAGNEIETQHNRGGDIVDVHRALSEPARPVAIIGVHLAVPIKNKPSRAQRDHVDMSVLSVILGNHFGQNLAAAIPAIRPINAGRRDEYDLADAGRSSRFENLESAACI